MIAPEIARQRMQEADPVSTSDDISDDLVAEVRAIIDAEIADGDQAVLVKPTQRTSSAWVRRGLAVAAAFAVTIVLVGLVGLFRTDETPVGEPATTVTTVATTVAPETTAPSSTPTTATPPASTTPVTVVTTIPPKPASLEISWERVPEQASLQDGWIAAVAEGDSGFVAVGGTVGCSDPTSANCRLDAAVWLSNDGITWERIESDSFSSEAIRGTSHGTALDGDQRINDVARGPEGFVAVGAAPIVDLDRAAGYLERPGIWVSGDGRQWQRLPHDEDVFARIDSLLRIVFFEDRFVATGGGAALSSADGMIWERSSVAGTVLDLTIWGDSLVAVGETSGHPAVWTSDDGLEWAAVEHPALLEASGNLQGVGGNGDGLVAIGTSSVTARVTTWRSANGTDWSIAPEWLGGDQEWQYTARTALSVDRGTGGIEDDLILINGGSSATLWGTADAGQTWYPAGQFDGGPLEVLASGAPAVFNTVNEVLVTGDSLLAFGKVVAWSGTEPIGGLCYVDPGDGSLGSCRSDAAIWVGTWDTP